MRQIIDIDGNKYKTIEIGNQEWIVNNLDVCHFRNGEPIQEVKTAEEWEKVGKEGQPAWCYYENDPENGKKYGKLYNWYAVDDPRGLAPAGWHVPSDTEWSQLTDYFGGWQVAGTKLKSRSGWKKKGNGTNESGFNGLPGGERNFLGSFFLIGHYGRWWSAQENSSLDTWPRSLGYIDVFMSRNDFSKVSGFSVRCLKD